jgi:hypothetical protein
MTPASVTGLPAQIVCDGPAFTIARGLMVIITLDATVVQGPPPSGSSVVKTNVTVPAEMSAEPGV